MGPKLCKHSQPYNSKSLSERNLPPQREPYTVKLIPVKETIPMCRTFKYSESRGFNRFRMSVRSDRYAQQ